jgi:DNA mismatch repair ATPase MutS
MEWYLDQLRRLRVLVDPQTVPFRSSGFTALAAMLQEECSDAYLESVDIQLKALRFPNGTLLSAALGEGNGITSYRLHQSRSETRRWFPWFFSSDTDGYRFSIHERDEAGARELGEIRDRAINSVSNVLAQSSLHILGFFEILRAELAFYIGCLNLHDRLTSRGLPTCRPRPEPAASRTLQFEGLYDVCLAVQVQGAIVGNTLDAGGKTLLVITGANQGGKSTFLRSIGLAQIMMQCGMFVGAEAFAAELCTGVFTHYRREEDASMQHGKLDEELARASDIIDLIKPNALVLLNESFASTNAIEGAEIARQFVVPMVDARIKVLFVTHLYEFARRLFERSRPEVLFLRAERRSDGSRTFRVTPGEPLETSHGRDLYREVFGD